jgi:hypothetical protein
MTTYQHVLKCSNPECQKELSSYSGTEEIKLGFCSFCGAKMLLVSTEPYEFEVKETSKIKFELQQNPIEINPNSIAGKLNFSIEEINEFPELNETSLPNNIELKQKNPECNLRDGFCVNYGGKDCCLRLLHEKAQDGRKPIFELYQCEFEGANIEETEGFEVET